MPQDDKRKRARSKIGVAADGGNSVPESTTPSPDPASPTPQATSPVSASNAAEPAAQTEWTVSDRRGPLNAAVPEDDVERLVPGSETDAEGAPDHTTLGPAVGPTHSHDLPAPSTTLPGEPVEPAAVAGAAVEPPEPLPTGVDPERHADHEPEHAAPVNEAVSSSTAAGSHEASHRETPPTPRRSFGPLAAGFVIGAAIGAGSAALVYWQLAGSDRASQVDAGRFAALSSRVDALDKRPDPQPVLAATKHQLDDLAGKVAALDQRSVAAVPAKPTAAPTQPTGAVAQPPAAAPASDPALVAKVAALQASLDAVQKQGAALRDVTGKIDALQAAVTAAQASASTARTNADAAKTRQQALDERISAVQGAAGAAQKQAATAQSGLDAVQSQQTALAGKLGAPALAVVADSLVTQVASGKPFAAQVDALTALGADPVKVVVLRQNASSGVTSAQSLLADFGPLADPILATGRTAPAGAGFAERLKHGLIGLVSVRRTDTTAGTDLPSRVATIQADLAHDDVPGAYAVWEALPPAARQRSQTWGTSAKASTEAINAARSLQTEAIGMLAAKKS